jgi:glucose/mannose transport system substrate-binding protein
VTPPLIRDLCRIEGHYYAIPINVHRTNVVWYNKALLDKHKIDPASITSWDAFFKAAETLKAAKVPFPIQMGTTWTAAHVFESILASLGIEAYEDWINGKISTADDPRLLKAVNLFGSYLGYVNDDHAALGWDVAIRRVIKGESAFCLMGDFANGEFRGAWMKYGRDYGSFLVPETKGLFGVNVDTFVRPRAIGDPVNSNRWMALAGSREGQDAFNPLKGSIPARTDSDLSGYDLYQRSAIADLKSARYLYPNSASALPEGFNNQVNEALVAFMADRNAPKARAALASAAARLKGAGTYRRTWSLK